MPVVVEVAAEVAALGTIGPTSGLIGVVLADFLHVGWEVVAPRSIGSIA
jgi:hypothetical protein